MPAHLTPPHPGGNVLQVYLPIGVFLNFSVSGCPPDPFYPSQGIPPKAPSNGKRVLIGSVII